MCVLSVERLDVIQDLRESQLGEEQSSALEVEDDDEELDFLLTSAWMRNRRSNDLESDGFE